MVVVGERPMTKDDHLLGSTGLFVIDSNGILNVGAEVKVIESDGIFVFDSNGQPQIEVTFVIDSSGFFVIDSNGMYVGVEVKVIESDGIFVFDSIGQPQIEVTFVIDSNGILNVGAEDKSLEPATIVDCGKLVE